MDEHSNETNSMPDLNKPKNDLIVAIDEYDSMLKDLKETKNTLIELTKEIPTEWRCDEYFKLKISVRAKLGSFTSQVNILATVYEDAVEFATNIIKELKSIVFDEKYLPWDSVESDDKKKLIEMINIRLTVCTGLLGFCNELKPEISTLPFEVNNLFVNSNNQFELFMKNVDNFGYYLSEKRLNLKPIIEKLSNPFVDDFERHEDEYGRYEFNKLHFNWKKDITNWKINAYRSIASEDIILVSKDLIEFINTN